MTHLQHRRSADGMLMGSSSRSPVGDAPASPKYTDRLSPAINNYLSEASRQEVRVSLIFLFVLFLFLFLFFTGLGSIEQCFQCRLYQCFCYYFYIMRSSSYKLNSK